MQLHKKTKWGVRVPVIVATLMYWMNCLTLLQIEIRKPLFLVLIIFIYHKFAQFSTVTGNQWSLTYKWYILLWNRNRTTIHHHANLLSEGMNKFDGSGHNDDVSNRTGLLLISSKYIRISRTPSTPIETLLFRDSLGPWFQDSQMQGYPRHFIWALFLHTGKVVFMH